MQIFYFAMSYSNFPFSLSGLLLFREVAVVLGSEQQLYVLLIGIKLDGSGEDCYA